jgi:HD-like signal output (HDOD) protein
MSVTSSLLEMNRISRDLKEIISRTKWKSISTCFMRVWKMRFDERFIAPILSHHNIGDTRIGIPSSDGRDYQESSAALVLDSATVACFLQL